MKNLKKVLIESGFESKHITYYTNQKAKVSLDALRDTPSDSKLVLVTAMTPTPKGEGKTTISIGLGDGLNLLGKKTILALREPSLGPVFGIKGGAVGGGKTTVVPGEDINLHFNGDFHAITSAHNLLSAAIDNHFHFGNPLKIKEVTWPRAIDMNDRSLREIETIFGKRKFVITAASEIMAILALCLNIDDLRERLSNIIIGINEEGKNVFARELNCIEGLMVLLKDAIKPNIVLSSNGTPAIIHCGPFANVAHGCNSVIATKMALGYAQYVVTEAGFGSDLGAEKFLDIKVPLLNKVPDCVVIVATIGAIKYHGESQESSDPIASGLANLKHHINNIKQFNLQPVIALNVFDKDSEDELSQVEKWCHLNNYIVSRSRGFLLGPTGCTDLAQKVIASCESKNDFKPIYAINDSIRTKIDKVAKKVYGAGSVSFSKKAEEYLDSINDLKYNICIAKTPLSLSGDAKLLNVPSDFVLQISNIIVNNGSRLVVCYTKGIVTLPGLNEHPRYEFMKLKGNNEVIL